MSLADDIARIANKYRTVSSEFTDYIAAGLEAEYVLVKRSDLPEVTHSKRHGFTTALAQQGYQPKLTTEADCETATPEWSERIAYANLAVAEAMRSATRNSEARLQARRDELAAEIFAESMASYDVLTVGGKRAIDRIIERDRRIAELETAAAGRDGGQA